MTIFRWGVVCEGGGTVFDHQYNVDLPLLLLLLLLLPLLPPLLLNLPAWARTMMASITQHHVRPLISATAQSELEIQLNYVYKVLSISSHVLNHLVLSGPELWLSTTSCFC